MLLRATERLKDRCQKIGPGKEFPFFEALFPLICGLKLSFMETGWKTAILDHPLMTMFHCIYGKSFQWLASLLYHLFVSLDFAFVYYNNISYKTLAPRFKLSNFVGMDSVMRISGMLVSTTKKARKIRLVDFYHLKKSILPSISSIFDGLSHQCMIGELNLNPNDLLDDKLQYYLSSLQLSDKYLHHTKPSFHTTNVPHKTRIDTSTVPELPKPLKDAC